MTAAKRRMANIARILIGDDPLDQSSELTELRRLRVIADRLAEESHSADDYATLKRIDAAIDRLPR